MSAFEKTPAYTLPNGVVDNSVETLLKLPQIGGLVPSSSGAIMGSFGLLTGTSFDDASSSRQPPRPNHVLTAFQQLTNTTTGDNAGFISHNSGQHITATEALPTIIFCFYLESITDVRLFAGVSDITTVGAGVAADNIGQEAYGVQFSTSRGDTSFHAISHDGTSQTTTDIGGSIAIETPYLIIIDTVSTSKINVSIYNASTQDQIGSTISLTTNIPKYLGMSMTFGLENLNSNIVGIRSFYHYIVNKAYTLNSYTK